MHIQEVAKQLQAKKRSIADLARFISTRTDNNPNYTLLLGAGCSISSGVRSADELIRGWRSNLCPPGLKGVEEQRKYLKEHFADWYDPNREYSSLFERKFDLQRQRRMFVEKEVSGKTPSLGYAYLTSLVNQNFFNTIFTTNFDDLINEAFYLYSDQRPIVCAHDSSINSITVTSKRPKVIKLHGDYLFEDLKATARETESLEQNTKEKFSEFAKDYGLIVVGYAGRDRSIMDCLFTLLKNEDYFKSGIYWCLGRDSEVSEELRKLLWKERTYFVEIDGFDELFAELYAGFNDGEVLPFSTISVTRRPAEIVSRLIRDQEARETESPVLKSAREELIKQSKRTNLMSLMLHPEKDKLPNRERLSDDELITHFEIDNLLNSGNYRDAIEKGREALKKNLNIPARRGILDFIARAHRFLGESSEAVNVIDELIALEPYNAAHLLKRADLQPDMPGKFTTIDRAISVDPYFVRCYRQKARLFEQQASDCYGPGGQAASAAALEQLETGIALDPSWDNSCWDDKFDLIKDYERDKAVRDKKLQEIIDHLAAMNPWAYTVLSMRMRKLGLKKKGDADLEKFLSDVYQAMQRIPATSRPYYEGLRLAAIAQFKSATNVADAIAGIESAYELSRYVDLAVIVAEAYRDRLGRDQEAASLLRECLKLEFDSAAFTLLLGILIDLNEFEEAGDLFNKWANRLSPRKRSELKVDLLDAKKDFDGALNEISRHRDDLGKLGTTLHSYLLLRKGAYAEAETYLREFLNGINFSMEASAEVVNYELACKYTKSKVNFDRLEKLLGFTETDQTKAAIYALLNRRREMVESIKAAMEHRKSFRFQVARWPVFNSVRSDQDFIQAIFVGPVADARLKNASNDADQESAATSA